MVFSNEDLNDVILRYNQRLSKYGYSPQSLGWTKGKQDIRFDILTSLYNFENKSILDIGCGFGDLNKILSVKAKEYWYNGIDIVGELLEIGSEIYKGENIIFQQGEFLNMKFNKNFDYAIASGIFNHKLKDGNNYDFIKSSIEKGLSVVRDGIAFDFLSDKVNYKNDNNFYSSPEGILSLAYEYSRNVVIRNDYMPFEFSIFIFKDDSYDDSDTIFRRYKNGRD